MTDFDNMSPEDIVKWLDDEYGKEGWYVSNDPQEELQDTSNKE